MVKPARKKINTIVFDVDGVLIDPEFPRVLRDTLGVSPDLASQFFGGPFRNCLEGRTDTKVELLPFLTEWGWRDSVDEFVDLWLRSDSTLNAPAFRFARSLLDAGYRCVVASNQERHRAAYLTGQLDCFSRLFFSCDLQCRKPDVSFFESVRTTLDVPAREMLLLDDQLTNLLAAREDGWHAARCLIGEDYAALAARYELHI
jgi:putative hydrolase of the HAD superfamily